MIDSANQVLPYIVDLFKRRMDEFGNQLEVVSHPGRNHYLGEGNEKDANYFDEEIMGCAEGGAEGGWSDPGR